MNPTKCHFFLLYHPPSLFTPFPCSLLSFSFLRFAPLLPVSLPPSLAAQYFVTPSPPNPSSFTGDADWSDYALWWPDKAIWLNKPRQTLYAYGIMADAKLEFVPVHRYVTIELPNHHKYHIRVNFAIMTLFTVGEICQHIGIRHPEELSLMRSPQDKENFAKLTGWTKRRKVCY